MSIFDKIVERVGDIVDEVFLPDSVRVIHDESRAMIAHGNFEMALKNLRTALVQHPDISKTHHLIGMAEFYLENYRRALNAFDRANQLRESQESLFYAALSLEGEGEFRKAQSYLERIAFLGKVDFLFDVNFALARINAALGHYQKAIRFFLKAKKENAGQNDVLALLANTYCIVGEYTKSAEIIASANLPDDNVLGLIVKAKIFESKDAFDSAREKWERAGELADRNYADECVVGLARNLNALEEYDTSLLLLNGRDVLDQFKYERHVLLGQAYSALKNASRGGLEYEEALKIEPFGIEALLGRGTIAIAAKEKEAGTYFDRVLESNDENGKHRAYYGLGLAKQLDKDSLSARHMFEEALEYEGNLNLKIWEILGDISLSYGDAAEALWWFNKANDYGVEEAGLDQKKERAISELVYRWDLPGGLETLDDIRKVMTELGNFLSNDGRLGAFMPSYQAIIEAINAPLSVALLGEFNAGKSSVVNALIGEKVVPVGVIPTTAQSGVIRFGPRKAARIVMVNGEVVEENFAGAKKMMKSNSDDIDYVEFSYPHPQLRLVNFWDTPGFNALEARHERVAKKALNSAEAILWVMDANQVLSQTQREQIDSVTNSAQRLIIIINKIDRVDSDAIEHLKAYVEEHIGSKILAVFGVSAKLAEKEETYEASCFGVFSAFFEEKVVQKASGIKAIDARLKVENFAMTLWAFQKGMKARVDGARDDLKAFGIVLEKHTKGFPKAVIREEMSALGGWSQMTLKMMEREIAAALIPVGTWSGKKAFQEGDRGYILDLIDRGLDRVLDRSFQRISSKVSRIESEFSLLLEPILLNLPLQNARVIQRSIQAFFDESRRQRVHLDKRVFGTLRALTRGKIEAAGRDVLSKIEVHHSDSAQWRSLLLTLLPDFSEGLEEELLLWIASFFENAHQLEHRISSELEILQLESDYRFDVKELLERI